MIHYLKEFKHVFGNCGIIGLCYLAKTMLPNIENYWQNPILYVTGVKASGKTEFVKSMLHLYENKECKFANFKNVKYESFRACLREQNTYTKILHIDDINKPLTTEWKEIIKSAHDPFHSKHLIISGEQDLSNDVSLYSRTIHIELDNLYLHIHDNYDARNALKALLYIRENAEVGFFKFRSSIFHFLRSAIKAEIIINASYPNAEGRLKRNYASLLAGYLYYADIMPFTESEAVIALISNLSKQQIMLSNEKKGSF
ncbi:MAG: AAA family ATPase [Bacteroidaceae bacterium]|nr:AAA family ATPase [Bacteroidaceae bacterium]